MPLIIFAVMLIALFLRCCVAYANPESQPRIPTLIFRFIMGGVIMLICVGAFTVALWGGFFLFCHWVGTLNQ